MVVQRLGSSPREFVNFMNSIKGSIPAEHFIKLDFKYQLGWYLDYLDKNGVVIVINRVSYRLYYAKSKIVKRRNFKEDDTAITIWKEAIIDAFNYLEKPF